MIFTLYKYVFRELLRVFILALLALTLILSIGCILQPIQEYGAGPRQIIIFMIYFLPITLTFVLPMAALFAGALVYGRFTSDNELDACRASGISAINLVVPGLLLAIVVSISNLTLSFYVMPTFVKLAEKSLKADIKQMLFRSIQQKGFYEVPPNYEYLIYADDVALETDTLFGVVLAKLKRSELEQIYTTEKAKVSIIEHEKSNEIQIIPINIYQISAKSSVLLGSTAFTTEFGSLLVDDIAFKNIEEMKRIKNDLMLFDPISQSVRKIIKQLTLELLAQNIQNHITSSMQANETAGQGNEISDIYFELSGDLEIIEFDTQSKRILHNFKSREAYLRIVNNMLSPSILMDIRSVRDIETGNIKMRHSVSNLRLPKNIEEEIQQFNNEKGSINTIKLSTQLSELSGFNPSEKLIGMQSGLAREIKKTYAQMKSEIHSRLVFGIGCIAMIFIGISLGIIKRGGHLLSAFGISCLPAAILLVCIMSGKQLTENLGAQTVSGITIMWAGLSALFLLAAVLYLHLMRN